MGIQEGGLLGRAYDKIGSELYLVARLLIGFLFALHGSQKLFGVLTDRGAVDVGGLFWFAGLIEFAGGILIAVGIFTRLVASLTAIEMLVAYFMVHLPNRVFPVQSGGGETVLLFTAAFLVFSVYGSGRWGLERLLANREVF